MMKRLQDLLIKILSVKGLFTAVCTVFFFLNPEKEWAFWAFLTAWLTFIGERMVLKILSTLKK